MNRRFLRGVLIALELLALYVLENTPRMFPALGGVRPLLLTAAAFSLTSELVSGATFCGAVCGVLTDLADGSVGVYAVGITVLCYAQSTCLHTSFRRNLPSLWLLSLAALALLCGADALVRLVTDGIWWQRFWLRAGLTYLCVFPLSVLNFRRERHEA